MPKSVPADETRQELERILGSPTFLKSGRLRRFLTLSVEWTLQGRAEELKESTLGREVFDRGADYDPRADSIVRVEAQRLRRKLDQYYATEGNRDAVQIRFRPGSYAPEMSWREEPAPAAGGDFEGAPEATVLARDVIAVMPFSSLKTDAELEYLSEGVQEALIQELTRIPDVKVLARSTVSAALRRYHDELQVNASLGAGTRIEGTLWQSGPRLRMTAAILDSNTGHSLWGTTLEYSDQDLFQIHDEVAAEVAGAVRAQLGLPPGSHAAPKQAPGAEAYTTYLRARHAWSLMTPASLESALEGFSRAIALEPGYAAPYAGLADVYYWFTYLSTQRPQEAVPKAKRAALEAIRLDPSLVEARTTLAALLFMYDRDWVRAERIFRQALDDVPGYAMTWSLYGVLLLAEGRFEQGLAAFERARETDPLSARTKRGFGLALYLSRRYQEAEPWLDAAIEMSPQMAGSRDVLIRARLAAGNTRGALECARQVRLGETSVMEVGAVAAAYARNGDTAQALRLVEEMRKGPYVDPMALATAYAGLGDPEETLRQLSRGVGERSPFACWFHLEPIFDMVREDRRFQALVARLELPEKTPGSDAAVAD